LEHYRDGLDLDTARQDQVERRLAAIEELARKNRVTPTELVARSGQLTAELETVERADTDLAILRRELASALEGYRTLAAQLSAKRSTAGRALSKDITTRMQTLGMSGGRFQVEVTQDGSADPTQHGVDQIEFRVTANPGQPLRALSKVASGGELSRLSLAVQVSVAARETRCMVFDEVDSGIGGAVAEIVGRELRSLAERGQVLCVTHLPQVASQAHHHLRVAKQTDGRTTRTALTELQPQERVEELARMLGGIEVTSKAREHAREMLRTHLELPPEPSPTDKMPALTSKGLLAQAKVASQAAKENASDLKGAGRPAGAPESKTDAKGAAQTGKGVAQPAKAAAPAETATGQPGSQSAAQSAGDGKSGTQSAARPADDGQMAGPPASRSAADGQPGAQSAPRSAKIIELDVKARPASKRR
jgi:hypothetical protein